MTLPSTDLDNISRCAEDVRPDVTLVDVNLGAESGFELAEQLHRFAEAAPSPVILISTHAEADYADSIAASPAIGFLGKLALTPGAVRDLIDRSVSPEGDRD